MDQSETQSRLKKALANRSARSLSVLALLALAPVALFAAGRSLYAGVVTTVNVLLIFGSIYLLTSPVESERDHADGDSTP